MEDSQISINVRLRMTVVDRREKDKLDKTIYRMKRNYWIRLMHKHGYTNVEIAKQVGLTESSVRSILKKL